MFVIGLFLKSKLLKMPDLVTFFTSNFFRNDGSEIVDISI